MHSLSYLGGEWIRIGDFLPFLEGKHCMWLFVLLFLYTNPLFLSKWKNLWLTPKKFFLRMPSLQVQSFSQAHKRILVWLGVGASLLCMCVLDFVTCWFEYTTASVKLKEVRGCLLVFFCKSSSSHLSLILYNSIGKEPLLQFVSLQKILRCRELFLSSLIS